MSQTTARICIPICEQRAGDIPAAIGRANEFADLIELRLDYLLAAELDQAINHLSEYRRQSTCPLLLTLRPGEQGGMRELTFADRIAFWRLPETNSPDDYRDFELDLALDAARRNSDPLKLSPDWQRVICSHHDFTGVPDDLALIYHQMKSTPARILKIAVRANEITDCLPVFHLLEQEVDRLQRADRYLIAIAMDEAGLATRILAPSRGSFLTYGALDTQHASAPGQLSAADLRQLYRLPQLNTKSMVTGLIGAPVSHSLSPHMHNAAFAALGTDAVYLPFEVRSLDSFMRRMVNPRARELEWNLRGLSVTAPHKTDIVRHLDKIDQAAQEIGAVNTVLIEGRQLIGSNTDAAASVAPLKKYFDLPGARIAVLGAGGAARAMLWQLQQERAQVTVFARDTKKAEATAKKFGAELQQLQEARLGEFDAVINTTPLGTRGPKMDESAAMAGQLQGARLAYDLVYNPAETKFLREAREAGCYTLGGLPMLIAQAAAQFELWTGTAPSHDIMFAAAQQRLIAQRQLAEIA